MNRTTEDLFTAYSLFTALLPTKCVSQRGFWAFKGTFLAPCKNPAQSDQLAAAAKMQVKVIKLVACLCQLVIANMKEPNFLIIIIIIIKKQTKIPGKAVNK